MVTTNDGKRRREKGAFTERKAQLQRRQQRHDRILAAAKAALANDDVWLALDGYRLLLTHDQNLALSDGFYTLLAIVRTKRFGLCIGEVNEKDRGHVTLYKRAETIGLRRDQTLVFIRAVEKDGGRLRWLP